MLAVPAVVVEWVDGTFPVCFLKVCTQQVQVRAVSDNALTNVTR